MQHSGRHVFFAGRILIQPPSGWRRSSPSPPPKEERAGERRPLLLNAPHPNPLPTRSSRGEGENFWWLCQDAPVESASAVRRASVTLPLSLVERVNPLLNTKYHQHTQTQNWLMYSQMTSTYPHTE